MEQQHLEDFNKKIPKLDVKAQLKINNLLEKDKALRISVISGGCNGFTYFFEVSEIKNIFKEDIYISSNPVVITDPISLEYMIGSTIKWIDNLMISQFVVDNPQAKQFCGCGTSFCI